MSTRSRSSARRVAEPTAGSGAAQAVSLPSVVLVATSVVMATELVRTTGPLLDRTYVAAGLAAAIIAAVLTYAAPGPVLALTAAVSSPVRQRWDLVAVVGLAVVVTLLRLGAQATTGTPRYWLGLVAVAAALGLVFSSTAVLSARDRGGGLAAGAVAVGVAVGMSLHLALGTWDAFWRHSLLGWSVALVMAAVLLVSAVLTAGDVRARPTRSPRRLWAVGPYLALALVMFGSIPFAASQSDLPAVVAGPTTAAGLLVAACWLTRRSGSGSRSAVASGGLAVAVVALTWLALRPPGDLARWSVLELLALVALGMAATLALAVALEPVGPSRDGEVVSVLGPRLALAGTAAGLGVIVPPLVYLVGYDTPLGFPNHLAIVAAGALLAVGALGRGRPASEAPASAFTPVLAVAAALAVTGAVTASGVSVTRPTTNLDSTTPTAEGSVRVMIWNVHYGVGEVGSLELEELARTVERHDPDVLLLNEVNRGWLIGGGADAATWLSDRLGGHSTFAPAADQQFGNMVLSRWPLRDVTIKALPYGDGPQKRSAVATTVATGSGELTTVAVHLQMFKHNAPTRILQLDTLLPWLDSLPGESVVLGGDMNFRPGDREVDLVLDAGFRSAVDDVGDPGKATMPSSAPTARYDWVFGRGVEFVRAEVLTDELASDHLPVLVTLVP